MNMGNFLQENEKFFFRLQNNKFTDKNMTAAQKGWLSTYDPYDRVTDSDFWTYAQIPIPGVLITAICNEANASLPAPAAPNSLDGTAPDNNGHAVFATENIIGWDTTPLNPAHSSWRSTFQQLGFGLTDTPTDMQTQFNFSASTLRWMSEHLSTIRDFKVHDIKQLTRSTQGHSMQAYFLATESPYDNVSQHPRFANLTTNRLNGSRHTTLAIHSFDESDSKVLACAFAFGYRIKRDKHFRDYDNGEPRYYAQSNYTPWILAADDDTSARPISTAQFTNMNSTFEFGSQPFMNVARFSTHGLNRLNALGAALVLWDTR
jgi:hypothetical protein